MAHILTWNDADAKANALLKQAMRQTKYKWAWYKLNRARMHIIEHRTVEIDEDEWYRDGAHRFVTNGDAYCD